jgi:GH18 family chitinase
VNATAQTYYDPVSRVKFTIFNGNQWVSYDDEQSFTDKKAYLTSHCISGAMIWAVDQDDAHYDAITGLLGEEAAMEQGGKC